MKLKREQTGLRSLDSYALTQWYILRILKFLRIYKNNLDFYRVLIEICSYVFINYKRNILKDFIKKNYSCLKQVHVTVVSIMLVDC